MNDTPDALERELARLDPVGPSAKLRDRIASRLAVADERQLPWKECLLAAGALAAGIVLALAPSSSTRSASALRSTRQEISHIQPMRDDEFDRRAIKLADYALVLDRPMEALDALLDRDPARYAGLNESPPRIHAFSRSNVNAVP